MEYKFLILFIFIGIIISFLIYTLSYILIPKVKESEKLSSYECGFYPFEEARNTFNVQYYLVGILFLVFDLEIVYLLPWAVVISKIDRFGIENILLFILILIVGLIYEWKEGGLDWD